VCSSQAPTDVDKKLDLGFAGVLRQGDPDHLYPTKLAQGLET